MYHLVFLRSWGLGTCFLLTAARAVFLQQNAFRKALWKPVIAPSSFQGCPGGRCSLRGSGSDLAGGRVRKRAEHLGYVVSAPREALRDNAPTRGSRVLAGCWGAGREEGRENGFHHLEGSVNSILKPCCLFGHFRGCGGIK